jgi:homoserine dehydrogenase
MSGRGDQRPVGVGILGFGTIGTGVVKVLQRNADVIEQRLGFPLRLVRVADLDLESDRGVDLGPVRFDSDGDGLLADPEVEIVVELIGGYDVARRMILQAVENGKHVVTANKALLALHGAEIFGKAAAQGVDVAFEASVGGGIPILRSVREGLAANHIEALYGILNGTTNYVLTQMESSGEDFDVVLKRAQELGYAEADPTFDIEGIDAAHKLALLAGMAFGAQLTHEQVPTEGIVGLEPVDFEAAEELGYRIKLLGIAKCHREDGSERVEVRVHPTLISRSSLLASVDGAMNAVAVQGDAVGETLFYGPGAGELPTASAVVADLMEIAREIRRGSSGRVAPLSYMPEVLESKELVPLGDLQGRFFLHFTALDRAGVLGHLASELGEHGIGIESVIQKGRAGSAESVPVIVLTHPAPESAVRAALARIDGLPDVTAPTRLLRIEEGL